jgi:hypothetical protein
MIFIVLQECDGLLSRVKAKRPSANQSTKFALKYRTFHSNVDGSVVSV